MVIWQKEKVDRAQNILVVISGDDDDDDYWKKWAEESNCPKGRAKRED